MDMAGNKLTEKGYLYYQHSSRAGAHTNSVQSVQCDCDSNDSPSSNNQAAHIYISSMLKNNFYFGAI